MFRKADTRKANQTIEGWEPLDSTTLALDGDGSLFVLELTAEVTESHGWADAASKSTPALPKKRSRTSVRLFRYSSMPFAHFFSEEAASRLGREIHATVCRGVVPSRWSWRFLQGRGVPRLRGSRKGRHIERGLSMSGLPSSTTMSYLIESNPGIL